MTSSTVVRRSIRVAAGSPEKAHDLARVLALHGLPGHVSGDEVVLASGRERMNSLLADLAIALGRWLEDSGRESISLTAGGRRLRYERSGRYAEGPRRNGAP